VAQAHVVAEVYVTKVPGDAMRLAETVVLGKYDGVLIASGDGLVYEWVNGIMKRDDWREALEQMPIGSLPGGSGNALAKSVLVEAGDPGAKGTACPFANAAFTALRARPPYRRIDIAAVDLGG
jgi:sphingosine kinase